MSVSAPLQNAAPATLATNHSPVVHAVRSHQLSALLPESFRFTRQLLRRAVGRAAKGSALAITSLFLFSQIEHTPSLKWQMALLAAVGLMAGVAYIAGAVHDLYGKLTIDVHGIHLTPHLTGFSINWRDLDQWDVQEFTRTSAGFPRMKFWLLGDRSPVLVPSECFHDDEYERIASALRRHCSEKEIARR